MLKTCCEIGIQVPEILLPGKNVDLSKWSVVACDQYTSQPEYWNKVEKLVGECPSTLCLTFPEVYLDQPGADERIRKVNESMEKYLKENILVAQKPKVLPVRPGRVLVLI